MKQHKTCNYNIWLFILIVVLTTLVVSVGLRLWQNQQVQAPVQTENSNWITYESQNGFSFQHPEGYGVNETNDPEDSQKIIIHIVQLDENGEFAQSPPLLQINVSQNSVSFALWEGREWEGYPEIISTFKSSLTK